jgi:hypothetical protein
MLDVGTIQSMSCIENELRVALDHLPIEGLVVRQHYDAVSPSELVRRQLDHCYSRINPARFYIRVDRPNFGAQPDQLVRDNDRRRFPRVTRI